MLPNSIKTLISEEQSRQSGKFIEIDFHAYLSKLETKAEIVADFIDDRCRGFVAYYCNDINTKIAFITLVLVDPQDRGLGIGQALTAFVLNSAKLRGFHACRLEVKKSNIIAYNMYLSHGFYLVDDRIETYLMEVQL